MLTAGRKLGQFMPPISSVTPLAPLIHGAASSTASIPKVDVQPYEDIPGPLSLPIIGSRWSRLLSPFVSKDFRVLHKQLRQTYGNIVRLSKEARGEDIVILYDPEDIEKVFRAEGPYPRRMDLESSLYYRRVLKKDKFDGAVGLLTNGKEWQEFRRRVQPHMLQPRAVNKYTEPLNTVAADFIKILRELRDKDGILPENTVNWLYRWSLESIATIALDTRLGCLNTDISGDPQKMIDAVQVILYGMFHLDVKWSLWRYISTPLWRRYVKALDDTTEISSKYIEQTMDRIRKKEAGGEKLATDLSVLEKLLLTNDNPRVATTTALDMMVAGIDTTSHASASLFYLLSRNPDKQEELHAELRRVLSDKDTSITSEHIQEMKYLRACVKESMRMLPVTSGTSREITTDNVVVGNYKLRKGVFAAMITHISSVDPEYFPEADRFLPERWLRDNELHRKAHPFASLPFGFGARMCIGMRFAELEIEVLAAKFLRNFRVEYPREATFQTTLLNSISSPLTFRITDRD